MYLLKGLSVAVIVLAFALGVALGVNGRPDQSEADAAKRKAHQTTQKRARAAAADEAYPLGLRDGMEAGTKEGRRKGKAKGLKDAGPTVETGGSTTATSAPSAGAAPNNVGAGPTDGGF